MRFLLFSLVMAQLSFIVPTAAKAGCCLVAVTVLKDYSGIISVPVNGGGSCQVQFDNRDITIYHYQSYTEGPSTVTVSRIVDDTNCDWFWVYTCPIFSCGPLTGPGGQLIYECAGGC